MQLSDYNYQLYVFDFKNNKLQICVIAKRKHNYDLLIANEEDIITYCDVNIKDDDNDAYQ